MIETKGTANERAKENKVRIKEWKEETMKMAGECK
jgi:hypothetical protein